MNGHEEILNPEEVAAITGRIHRDAQLEWLTQHGWRSELSAAGRPIIGRWYARMKLAGIDLASLTPGKLPDFGKIK
ncbi:uncharacterized protein DUF4224 [Nitrosospira sp. Nsp5]|uniref:DUF4224 domain-containing protein n=1 Tax=Nitrosospira multiformis TaxID=1231 RepID=A0ABY0TFC1_9PROT|nr:MULTISPECIES: DUF4224 domain-containing protein [Nitrosospira]PTR06162.1 uncharacterized protein DUF4224 [Nitrosospira sp. Nsp5]SDQ65846.1 protein of unknown function [Nitrosospira multiformis]